MAVRLVEAAMGADLDNCPADGPDADHIRVRVIACVCVFFFWGGVIVCVCDCDVMVLCEFVFNCHLDSSSLPGHARSRLQRLARVGERRAKRVPHPRPFDCLRFRL